MFGDALGRGDEENTKIVGAIRVREAKRRAVDVHCTRDRAIGEKDGCSHGVDAVDAFLLAPGITQALDHGDPLPDRVSIVEGVGGRRLKRVREILVEFFGWPVRHDAQA